MVQTATRPDQNLANRSDYLASQLAEELGNCKPRKDSFPIPNRLKKLKQFLQAAYDYFDQATKSQTTVSNASEWLLDNFYVIEQAIRVVEDDLPADYYFRLPKTIDGATRIYILALAINRDAPRLDIEQVKYFIQIFQRTVPLQVGEIWAIPLMLRLSILETLVQGLADITRLKWEYPAEPDPWKKINSASSIETTSITDDTDPESKVVNSILNLRLIATIEWKEFFEATSILEHILRSDPPNMYSISDFETRNEYRSVVEELARGSSGDESEIALHVIELAEAGTTLREQHIGYYLIAEGRSQLEKKIQFKPAAYN